ncbi:MAG TPA: hypothetical protein VKT77_04255 [Chthonomonadaceae bacterium]|nr:hypothetical protein [Chthonomonadaceae bacterium]
MISNSPVGVSKPSFSSQVLPGSAAEQQERERIAEFQRIKSEREAAAVREKPERDAARKAAHEAADAANRAMMRQKRSASPLRDTIRP